MAPQLPEDAIDALSQLRAKLEAEAAQVSVGQVWWVPRRYLRWFPPPPKNRYCLVAAVEATAGGNLAHLIAGTGSSKHGAATLHVAAGNGFSKDTYFNFRFSGSIPATTLTAEGNRRPDPGFSDEQIRAAVHASGRADLRRLWP